MCRLTGPLVEDLNLPRGHAATHLCEGSITRYLLHSITDRLVSRCSLGLATSLCKVKAHSGIQGNELADRGASAALAPHATPTFTVYCR